MAPIAPEWWRRITGIIMYGSGVVNAHIKAEGQSWAGTVIDQSVLNEIYRFCDVDETLSPYAIKYKVPYKKSYQSNGENEYVLKLINGNMDEKGFENIKNDIIKVFHGDNRDMTKPRANEILKNTLEFLSSHISEPST